VYELLSAGRRSAVGKVAMFALLAASVGAPARELQSGGAGAFWCNAYTCGFDSCSQSDVCLDLAAGSHCAGWCNSYTSGFAVCSGCYSAQPITYRQTTTVSLKPNTGIQTYKQLKCSTTGGYATLMGGVFSDPTIISEVPQFYSFLAPTYGMGYVTDAAMTGPDACAAYCAAESTCAMFYYQYEETDSSTMISTCTADPTSGACTKRWMHKCQLTESLACSGGTVFADDTNDYDEMAGRVSAAGSGY